MTTLREAMEQIERESRQSGSWGLPDINEAALIALVQPAEPVAVKESIFEQRIRAQFPFTTGPDPAPPTRTPMTDQEIFDIALDHDIGGSDDNVLRFARDIIKLARISSSVPARTPMSIYAILNLWNDVHARVISFARALERHHQIGSKG